MTTTHTHGLQSPRLARIINARAGAVFVVLVLLAALMASAVLAGFATERELGLVDDTQEYPTLIDTAGTMPSILDTVGNLPALIDESGNDPSLVDTAGTMPSLRGTVNRWVLRP